MDKLRSVLFTVGMMLAMLAAITGYFSIEYLSSAVPAESYEDRGVYTFSPYQVLPVQVKNTGASGRQRRMNPTKTVYMVYYRDTEGAGYQWKEKASGREAGERTVAAGRTVKRRVLAIPEDQAYITVEPEMTAQSYSDGMRQRYKVILGVSGAYILFYILAWFVVWYRKDGIV